jgi:hypothetical protein
MWVSRWAGIFDNYIDDYTIFFIHFFPIILTLITLINDHKFITMF